MNKDGSINLRYYKTNLGNGNFGDEMSPMLIHKITKRQIVNSGSDNKHSLVAIGSYIQKAKTNDIIWGSGVRRIDQEHDYNNLIVKAVRGPITRYYLKNINIDVPEIYGDPGLLFPKFYNITKDLNYVDKIGFVPHYTSLDLYTNLDKNIKIISPLDNPINVISKIRSCKYIVSSSLHGLIMADYYDIPNVWLYDRKLNEGILKFEDYFASQNRQTKMYNDLKTIFKSNFDDYGNKINLDILLNSFPKYLIKN